jgi:hypothetical protein
MNEQVPTTQNNQSELQSEEPHDHFYGKSY